MEIEKFKRELRGESPYPVTDAICDFILTAGRRVELKKNDILIARGQVDTSVYYILDGVLRGSVVNSQGVERTVGFGLCGTMIYSAQCSILGEPSIYQFQACSPVSLVRIGNETFRRHIDEDHEFCRWVMGTFALTICYRERGNEGLNNDALAKYKWLMENRPEIIEMVTDKVLASYLQISDVHLSRIKSRLLRER